ncbi:MAG: hypothetical protein KAK04_04640 [Cyclobacteriaceae bacterium]|nr:hypothetical protein [Cyclobacteriaceae bacterium]
MKKIFLLLIIAFIGCDTVDDPDPDIIPPSDYCNCEDSNSFMTVVVSSAPQDAYIRLSDGAYGANNFFMHALDKTASGYNYKGTDNVVETKIPDENWEVPSYLWAAGRAKTDGLDPFAPTAAEYFQYGVLPRTGWTSSGNAPPLVDGEWYLVRMVMGYSVNDKFNFASHCYQRVFKFERGTYE